jgi:triacylglycerol lipase
VVTTVGRSDPPVCYRSRTLPLSLDAAVALAERMLAALPDRRDDALAVINGMLGDHLEAAGSSLSIPMRLLGPDGQDLDASTDALPTSPSHACLFVHGLSSTERLWLPEREDEAHVAYGPALSRTHGFVPLYARYNTGRHVSTNGQELAARLEALCLAWPGFESLTIVGHSMGGLVVRSACHYGMQAGHGWVQRLRRVVLLGSPSHGAPLEQLAHLAAFTLDAIWNPITKLIGKAINLRSAGIKDLRHGYVLDEDWRHRDVDVLALRRPRTPEVPPGVRWSVALGRLGETKSALGQVLGDGLVRESSARGVGIGNPQGVLPEAQVRVFDGVSHVGLLYAPAVLEWISSECGEPLEI